MLQTIVLDASAMLAYARAEVGGETVLSIVTDATCVCYAHAVNVCEVYYDLLRTSGLTAAEAIVQDLLNVGVILREDMGDLFWRQVGQNKVAFTLALGDCFCLALAQHLGGEVVTSDHQFDPVSAQGACAVRFIR
jgi:PIN domain nuclease of toxin-antitoxin system